MPNQTFALTDPVINSALTVASVIAILTIPVIWTQAFKKRHAQKTMPQTVLTLEDLHIALYNTPTMFFCNN